MTGAGTRNSDTLVQIIIKKLEKFVGANHENLREKDFQKPNADAPTSPMLTRHLQEE